MSETERTDSTALGTSPDSPEGPNEGAPPARRDPPSGPPVEATPHGAQPARPERAPAEDLHDDPEIRAVLLDMGGVILDLGEARGLPWGELDRQGRVALLDRIREGGGTASADDLDRWLFTPWRRGYERRNQRGREESWGPHLARMQRLSGCRATRGSLLGAWAGPYLGGLRAVSGAQESLGRLVAADLRLGLVSNVPMPGSLYERVLAREGLAALFDALSFSYDRRARKPGPALVQRTVAVLEVEPSEAIMVGDRRSTDVAAGRAAGVRTVWVGADGGDADGPEPDATIGSLVELPALLGL